MLALLNQTPCEMSRAVQWCHHGTWRSHSQVQSNSPAKRLHQELFVLMERDLSTGLCLQELTTPRILWNHQVGIRDSGRISGWVGSLSSLRNCGNTLRMLKSLAHAGQRRDGFLQAVVPWLGEMAQVRHPRNPWQP